VGVKQGCAKRVERDDDPAIEQRVEHDGVGRCE
jgi:hypothetical protein